MPQSSPIRACALALCAALSAPGAEAQTLRACEVARLEGRGLRLWHSGLDAPLTEGPLPEGDLVISTPAAARVEIRCADGIVVTIGPNAEVTLEGLTGPAGGAFAVVLQLLEGLVGAVVPSRTWGSFDIRTPVVVASVRSTAWFVEHERGGGSAVFAAEGRVLAVAPGGAAILGPGEGVDVSAAGEPGPVVEWGPPRVEAARDRLGFGWR